MEIDTVYGDKGKKGKHAKGKKGKDKGKGKHKGKHKSSPKFEGYCGRCGKWGHKQKDCRFKNTVAGRICRASKQQCEQQHDPSHTTTSWFVLAGTAQSTTGMISNLVEHHAQPGCSCELVTGIR